MWPRLALLAVTILLATPSAAAAQAIGCDQSECGEVLPTTTLPPTTSTSVGAPAQVEVPPAPATTTAAAPAPAPAGGLPVTGADLVVLTGAGLSAIALGAGLRRRARRSS